MMHIYGSRSSTPSYNLLRQDSDKRCKVLVPKAINFVLNGGHSEKLVIYSSRSTSLANCCWNRESAKIYKPYKRDGIIASLQEGHASYFKENDNWSNFRRGVISLIEFSRPYSMIGTIIGITSVSLLPLETIADLSPTFFVGYLTAIVPSLLMSLYGVGVNQVYDVEIDKINKPNLPLASGNLSMTSGIAITSASLFMSLAMAIMFQSPPLLCGLLTWGVLYSAYSIEHPFLRWKKHPFLAASCIVTVRGLAIPISHFLHMQDIPDLDGDRAHGIQSLSATIGPERVFRLCVNMLFIAYGAAVVVGATSSSIPSKIVTILGHCTIALMLWLRVRSVDLSSKQRMNSFYMFLWQLSYMEYFLIPFVR